jgi:hypothetical protein
VPVPLALLGSVVEGNAVTTSGSPDASRGGVLIGRGAEPRNWVIICSNWGSSTVSTDPAEVPLAGEVGSV